MPEYVPYEQRAKHQSDDVANTNTEAEKAAARHGAESRLRDLLTRVGRSEPDYHIEVLCRIGSIRRRFTSKPVIERRHETVIIAEVVHAYQVRGAISSHRIKTEGATRDHPDLDAYITTDGRVWAKQNQPQGRLAPLPPSQDELDGVLQMDDWSALRLDMLTIDELNRLGDGLVARIASAPLPRPS